MELQTSRARAEAGFFVLGEGCVCVGRWGGGPRTHVDLRAPCLSTLIAAVPLLQRRSSPGAGTATPRSAPRSPTS
jgi:hypothetical protein